jgi:hypothetical protein
MSRTGVLHRPSIDRSDPAVQQFVAECGLATTAVSIRLVGEKEADVTLQITRLKKAFGSLIELTQPKQSGRGIEWIAYGTLLA